MEIKDNERKKLIKFCIKVGFLIQSKPYFELKTEREREERINTLINQGYRLMKFGNKLDVINLEGKIISQEIQKEIIEIYNFIQT